MRPQPLITLRRHARTEVIGLPETGSPKLSGAAPMVQDISPNGDVLRFLSIQVLTGLLLVFASACSSSETSEQFCELAQQNNGQVDASYVGSEEHVAAFTEMIAAAPDDVVDELTTIRNHLRDEVTAEDPDSRDIETYPADVRAAVEFSDEFIASECDVEMGP